MKKILIFSLAYYPSFVSGAEAAIKEITERINPSDIEFHMVTLLFDKNAPREERIGNVVVHRVGFGGAYLSKIFFVPLAGLKARSLDKEHHFGALWAMMTYMLFPVVMARICGVRTPHILTLQDGDPYEKVFERWFIRPVAPILDYGFRTASMVQAISVFLAEWPRKRGYKGPIELIYNGANPRDIKDKVEVAEIEAMKEKLGKNPGDIFLVNTSRLVHQKAFDDTIRALVKLPVHIKFLAVGDGGDAPMLKKLAEDLGVADRVIFTGKVDRGVVTLYRRASDIFVAPSRSEGLGNAFISALASRLPLIATQVGGMADYVFDEKHNPDKQPTAWVVDPDAPDQIVAKVQEILANPEKAKKISEHARKMVEEKYDWDNIAKQMRTRVFDAVLKRGNSLQS
ncbi:MAG: glycosyltransferase family 4 protein [Patescibacteria group bacterium]|mgnify:CR=1 FL=1